MADANGRALYAPPLWRIRAIDLATGKTLWDRPFGSARRNGPFGMPTFIPLEIGTPNNGGSVVTAGGLIFISAATDDLIKAIDIKTGDIRGVTCSPPAVRPRRSSMSRMARSTYSSWRAAITS